MNKRSFFQAAIAVSLIPASLLARDASAQIPNALEPVYADAVLAYHDLNYKLSMQILEDLNKKAPNTTEFLQMKALVHKALKETKPAAETYLQLVKLNPGPKGAPYRFELGLTFYEAKRMNAAKGLFEAAAEAGFNVGAARFFLGNIAFQAEQWDEADSQFRQVLDSDINDLKPVARFFLAQVAVKTGDSTGAVSNFEAARDLSKAQLDQDSSDAAKKVPRQIYDASTKALKPFDRTSWFASFSAVSGYDSNVLSVPSNSTGETTGTGSPKATLGAGFGYMSSPLKPVQFVPSYRGSFTYHTSENAKTGNSLSHMLSLYLNRGSLSTTGYGLRTDGTYLYQNVSNDEGTGSTLKPYSLTFNVGPYIRSEIARKLTLGCELTFGSTKNYLDDDLSDAYKRSGPQFVAKTYLKRDTGARWLNPGVALSWTKTNTKGSEYASSALGGEISNSMRLSTITQGTITVSYTKTRYPDRSSGARDDKNLTIGFSGSRKFSERWTGLFDFTIVNNQSTVPDSFEYKKWSSTIGATYGF